MARRAPVPARPVPQTEEEAAYHAQEYVKEEGLVKQLDAEEALELADVKQKFADRKKPHVEAREEHFALAQAWAEAHRDKRKTIKLLNGRELQWRLPSSPSLLVVGQFPTVVRLILRLPNWDKYLEIKPKKNNIKSDLDQLQKKFPSLRRMLRMSKTEYFRIK